MGRLLCRVVFWIFAAAYLLALSVFTVGVFGWFGVQPDPLSGVYLVLIGQPWIYLVDVLPEAAWPFAAALTPAINLCILFFLCRFLAPKRRPPDG